jgi:uncharacterized protein (TIGR02680 family)
MNDMTPKQFPDRWRLSRAGIVNVWHYLENTFDLSGGRMILRGTNGSGKSRALEMLLPFLLDADRRKMDATGSGRVNLDELMRAGAGEQSNRIGYLWLELAAGDARLTVGALIRHSMSSRNTQVWYFTTPRVVGDDLHLIDGRREPLTREALSELIGAESVTESPEQHRERIRTTVFGLHGDSGRDRYTGLLQLLHTLRAPDVGNRIDEGRLPQILSDALPPLAEQTLARAGEQLDGLTTLRQAQQQQEAALDQLNAFLGVYRRYASTVIADLADATLQTVDAYEAAQQLQAQTRTEAERLAADGAAIAAELEDRQVRLQGFENAISGLRDTDIFKRADDLHQRDQTVEAKRHTADAGLAEANRERDAHARLVAAADDRLAELGDVVETTGQDLAGTRGAVQDSGLTAHGLPDQLRLQISEPEPATPSIRADRDTKPAPTQRPRAQSATLVPDDLAPVLEATSAARDAAHQRHELTQHRLAEAGRLQTAEIEVRQLEDQAASAQQQATEDTDRAETTANQRDDSAITLVQAWRTWIDDPSINELLGPIDWTADPVIAPLLTDVEALCGPDDTTGSELDRTAGRVAEPARNEIARARVALDSEEQADQERRNLLEQEADGLRRAEDPLPPAPPWLTEPAGTPLWQTVDFADGPGSESQPLTKTQRAGLEGALLASGLLTATVEADGSLQAPDGQTLLSPGATAATPLSDYLEPDPAAGIDERLVAGILAGVGVGDDSPTSVDIAGNWRHGPLRGRHQPQTARHIGAAARAQARADRIAEIEAELAGLDGRRRDRESRSAALDDRARRLSELIAQAPASRDLLDARAVAHEAERRAEQATRRADAAQRRAVDARDTWADELRVHRGICQHHGLPPTAEELRDLTGRIAAAERRCTDLRPALQRLDRQVRRHRDAAADSEHAEQRCREAEHRAEAGYREWFDLQVEVAAVHDAIDLDVEQARQALDRAERDRQQEKDRVDEVHHKLGEVKSAIGMAQQRARQATADLEQARSSMAGAARDCTARIRLPGLFSAATEAVIPGINDLWSAESVRGAMHTLRSTVGRPSQPADATAVLRAFQTLDREVTGQLDVTHAITDGVAVVSVSGAGDATTVAEAAGVLTGRVAEGRAALSDREREVFTRFVLGGVAEELRRRINQAHALIDAMNASLASIRTSNGIGVRLAWQFADDDTELHRIAELVRTADAVRSTAQNDELTELLRRRVDAAYSVDPSSGYATHLSAALDYRSWHTVEVSILGPAPDQRRRLSRRAKLSQGETRFVSYVALFAAADGYLSGLSDTDRQLRLILLDDAFAKVDDPTIADLMGLLVRLDLDFVMTGHALWGCYPQVPALDVYEVRRHQGTAAVTTHVHWDGRTRHLKTA